MIRVSFGLSVSTTFDPCKGYRVRAISNSATPWEIKIAHTTFAVNQGELEHFEAEVKRLLAVD